MEFKFDHISDYRVLSKGYCDPPVWATYGSDDYSEYIVERGYFVKHNGHLFKVSDWVFITKKQWRVEQYDPKNKWNYKGDYETLTLALARVKELAK